MELEVFAHLFFRHSAFTRLACSCSPFMLVYLLLRVFSYLMALFYVFRAACVCLGGADVCISRIFFIYRNRCSTLIPASCYVLLFFFSFCLAGVFSICFKVLALAFLCV